jgi:protein O-GlcNAc transferase
LTSTADLSTARKLHAEGNLPAAAVLYQALLASHPDDPRVPTQLGLIRLQQKRLSDAHRLLRRALAIDPTYSEAQAWLGEVLRQEGNSEGAVRAFEAALRHHAEPAIVLFNLGLAQAELGADEAAQRSWLGFLELRPANRQVRRELGVLAYRRGHDVEAASWLSRQLETFPGDIDAACDLAAVRLRQREWPGVLALLEPLMSANPQRPRAYALLGEALLGMRRRTEALDVLLRGAAQAPQDADLIFHTGRAFDQLARLQEAIDWFRRAATLAPKRADIRNALGVAHLNFGDHAAAISHFQEAVALKPAFYQSHSNLLMTLHYLSPVDHDHIFAEHLRWAAQHADVPAKSRETFPNRRAASRPLQVGYVSPRFSSGPLARFFLPLLRAHDRSEFQVTCYFVGDEPDVTPASVRQYATRWRDCSALDDDELSDIIYRDEIDILVDLVGHSPGHRLRVFARRAAPLQLTWLDYLDTTAISAMDYLISDRFLSPPEGRQRFTESIVRLPNTRLCYQPFSPLPPVKPPPVSKRGGITFGSFNRISKYGPQVIETWADILSRVRGSRLVLKSTAFVAEQTRDAMRDRFARHGIHADRLDLRGVSDESDMLEEYNDIDIVLDPFPFNGGTTTCDALSMGVPVITLAGTAMAGRQGVAFLANCGLTDWIASSVTDYVTLACNAAAAPERLSKIRSEMRSAFLASPICDDTGFARAFEQVCRDLWVQWCSEKQSGHGPSA